MTALSIFSLSPLPSTSSSTLRHRQNPNRSPSPPRASFSFRSSPENEPTATEKFVENNSIADFVRFNKPSSSSSSSSSDDELQTAIVSYRKKFPYSLLKPFLRVDLVSTIHIADKEYFKALQKELETYDCVLYEMVASRESLENCRNTGSKKRLKSPCSRGFNVLGFIQRQMARILTLDFQLDCLDYQAENWHHADLNFETFKLLQTERGESLFTFARDMALQSTKAMMQPMIPKNLDPWRSDLMRASRVLPVPLVGLLIIVILCSDVEIRFTQMTAEVEAKSVIIGKRNKAAIDVLQQAIDEGHNRIAILYGGGHMPDLGRRLREDFNLVPSRVQWITAWAIRNRDS